MSEIFIAAPREMSARRLKQLFRHYLPKGNVTLGISREPYVLGFEGQPQFAMLQRQVAEPIVRQIERAGLPRSVKLLEHSQADTAEVFGQLSEGQRVLLVNGSWQYAFHNLPAAAVLAERGITHKFISPFADKQAFLGNAAALIVPSTFDEPFGMVTIEALACDTPVIGLDSGATPELIQDGIDGVIVPSENISTGIAQAIHAVTNIQPGACRTSFEARFTAARMATEYGALYQTALDNH
jgi:glycosyltransferase involved in cell wall biosynthesis